MEMFKKQSIAIVCMILMIVGSTLFQGIGDVKKEAEQLNDFFILDEGDGFSIQKTLESKLEFTNELANKFAIKHIDTNADEIVEVNKAAERLQEAETVEEKYDANVLLDQANNSLIGLLEKKAMDEDDARELNRFYANLSNCNDLISHSFYNEEALKTEKELDTFLAKLYKGLFNIEVPGAFK